MNNKKVSVALLSLLIFCSNLLMLTSCSKTVSIGKGPSKNKVVQIAEDSPWYDSKRMVCGEEYQEMGLDYFYFSSPIVTSDGLLFYVYGYKANAYNDSRFAEANINEYGDVVIDDIVYYGYDGSIIWKNDLSQYCTYDSEDSVYIEGIRKFGNECYVSMGFYTGGTDEYGNYVDDYGNYEYIIDMENGEIDTSTPADFAYTSVIEDEYGSFVHPENVFEIDSGMVIVTFFGWYNDKPAYTLSVADENEEVLIDLNDYFPKEDIWDISSIISIDDNKVILITSGSIDAIEFDLNTGEMSEYELPEGLEDLYLYNLYNVNGKNYYSDAENVYSVNLKTGTKETVFSFSECCVNLSEVEGMGISAVSDERIVLYGEVYGLDNVTPSILIYEFTPAVTNPNAGKVILTASNLGFLDGTLGAALYDFNTNNKNYFIQYNEKYTINHNDFYYVDSPYYAEELLAEQNRLYSKLSSDLMSGEGPDIILNAFSMKQLNSTDYLIDLTDYITEIDEEEYFMNIIEASRIDDKLYQIPISFGFDALYGAKNLSANNVGFTFNEYLEVVEEMCNGTDPMQLDNNRRDILSILLSSMSTPLINDRGYIELDTQEFRAICEYCKDLPVKSLFSMAEDENEFYGSLGIDYFDTGALKCINYGSLWSSLESFLGITTEDALFYGYPSYEGTGATATIFNSVAISASCPNCDAAWGFIETLLKPEILSEAYDFPISKTAFYDSSDPVITQYNDNIDNMRMWYTEEEATEYGVSLEYATKDSVKQIAYAIGRVTSVSSFDTQLLQIILEEIQPYFDNQKSLDDVIIVMENRCQAIINAR
ncbi:MAG: hypothetical protein MJ172_05735 [Clostridia bacterium]|nr:hypothetical protein [Clostridia bacterium]